MKSTKGMLLHLGILACIVVGSGHICIIPDITKNYCVSACIVAEIISISGKP
jgi:hypothetical protein